MAAIGSVIGAFVGVVAAVLTHLAAIEVSPLAVYALCGFAGLALASAASLSVPPPSTEAAG
jgi:hypothetical protein